MVVSISNATVGYGVLALLVYTAVLIFGWYRATKQYKRNEDYMIKIKEIFEEVIQILLEEENIKMVNTGKGNYRNVKASEFVPVDKVNDYILHGSIETKNKLTLTDLLTQEPKEEHYEEVLDLLIRLAKETYEDYKFLIAKSPDETQQSHFLQIVSNWNENPELHKRIFSKSFDYGLDMQELQKKFALLVKEGKVIPLGDDVVVITDDGTGQPPTGVSPINSGLEGGEIAFIISFIHKNNLEGWTKTHFPEPETEEEANE